MDKEEMLQLAYIKVAKAAEQMAGEGPLTEEAEGLAVNVDLAEAALHPILP